MDENDQDLLVDDDLMMHDDLDDDLGVLQTGVTKSNPYSKKSPNAAGRKGATLANISNTVHGSSRQGQNASKQLGSGDDQYVGGPHQKRMASHQNQFSKQQ